MRRAAGSDSEAAQRDDRQPFPRLNNGKRRRVSRPNPGLTLGTAGSAINATAKALLEHEPLFLTSIARRVEGWLRAAIGTIRVFLPAGSRSCLGHF
jgi:hypothetical protein